MRDKKGNYEKFESNSPPMGVVPQKDKSVYQINKIKLNENRFYAFTDGLSESENKNGSTIPFLIVDVTSPPAK